MVSCIDFQEDLSALLDDELKGTEKTELESHLSECDECTSRFETLKSLSTFLGKGFEPPESDGESESAMPDIWSKIKDELPSVCLVIEEDLSAYLDGELPPAAQEGVNEHLNGCSECLDKFKLLNATNQLLSKGLELPESVDVDLWNAVKKRLTEDCEIIASELSSYVDQEVATMRHRAITAHLLECHPCRTSFDGMTKVGEVIREHYKPVIPEDLDLWPGIKAKMRVVPFAAKTSQQQLPQQQKPKTSRPRWSVMAVAAAAVTALFSTLAFWLSSPDYADGPNVTAESYLIESSFTEPTDVVEAVVYDQ